MIDNSSETVSDNQPVKKDYTKKCENCGKMCKEEAKFCDKCGKRFSDDGQNHNTIPERKKSVKRIQI